MVPKRTSRASSPSMTPGRPWGHGGFVPSLSQDLAPGCAEQEHAARPGTGAGRAAQRLPHGRDRSQQPGRGSSTCPPLLQQQLEGAEGIEWPHNQAPGPSEPLSCLQGCPGTARSRGRLRSVPCAGYFWCRAFSADSFISFVKHPGGRRAAPSLCFAATR